MPSVGTQCPETNSNTITTAAGATVAGGIGAGAALGGAPAGAAALGFTTSGIAGGSTAASMMSVLGGGATQAGGIVATLQAIGATSTVAVSAPAVVAIGGLGAGVGLLGYGIYRGVRWCVNEEKSQKDKIIEPRPYRSSRRNMLELRSSQRNKETQTEVDDNQHSVHPIL